MIVKQGYCKIESKGTFTVRCCFYLDMFWMPELFLRSLLMKISICRSRYQLFTELHKYCLYCISLYVESINRREFAKSE